MFTKDFLDYFSISVKKVMVFITGMLRIYKLLFHKMVILTLLILQIWTWEVLPFSIFFNFFVLRLEVFIVTSAKVNPTFWFWGYYEGNHSHDRSLFLSELSYSLQMVTSRNIEVCLLLEFPFIIDITWNNVFLKCWNSKVIVCVCFVLTQYQSSL